MTREEAEKVVKIMLTADGWCSHCQGNLISLFKRAFPDHVSVADDLLRREGELESALSEAYEKWTETYEGDEPTVLDLA